MLIFYVILSMICDSISYNIAFVPLTREMWIYSYLNDWDSTESSNRVNHVDRKGLRASNPIHKHLDFRNSVSGLYKMKACVEHIPNAFDAAL